MSDKWYDVTIRLMIEPDEDSPESWDWRTLLDTSFVDLVSVQQVGEKVPTLTREQQDVLHDANDEFEEDVDKWVSHYLSAAADDAYRAGSAFGVASAGWDENRYNAQVLAAVSRRLQKIAEDNGGYHDTDDC